MEENKKTLLSENGNKEKIKKIKVRVVGIGGGGSNIVAELSERIEKASFLVVNTDAQALARLNKKIIKLQLGENIAFGMGTGMNPELAETIAKKEEKEIKKFLDGNDFLIFVSSLGGGMGSGATPVFTKIAKSMGLLTLGIFTLPFHFEGEKKMEIVKEAIEKIKPHLNALLVIPNERIFQMVDRKTPLKDAFSFVNRFLSQAIQSLIEIIYLPGLINVDFADLRTILEGRGKWAYLNSINLTEKEISIEEIIKKIIFHPLYPYGAEGASGMILNIAGSQDLDLATVHQISKGIAPFLHREAKIILGISYLPSAKTRITIFANGCKTKIFSSETENEKEKLKRKIDKKKIKNEKIILKERSQQSSEPVVEKKEIKIRKNALQVQKELEEAEREILEREKEWQTPTFLRKRNISI